MDVGSGGDGVGAGAGISSGGRAGMETKLPGLKLPVG